MNVILFKISLAAKDIKQDISESVTTEYKNKSSEKEYKKFVEKQWEEEAVKHPNIGVMYSKEYVLASKKIHGDHYFIVDDDHSDCVENAFLDVLILSNMENVDEAFNIVLSDIKKTLKASFSVMMKQKFVWLYIYSGDDIYTHEVKVKANIISNAGFTKKECIRVGLISILSVISFIIFCIASDDVKEFGLSIGCSGLFFLLSEVPVHLSTKKRIMIPEFTNDIFDRTPLYERGNSTTIATPNIKED